MRAHASSPRSTRRRGTRLLAASVALVVVACGCIEVKDTLTINADGSGTVRIETVFHYREPIWGTEVPFYPPVGRETAQALFPDDEGFDVFVAVRRPSRGTSGLVAEVEFDDINALVNSPYGRAHSLSLERDGDALVLKARSGMQTAARFGTYAGAMQGKLDNEFCDAVSAKYNEMAFEFTIVMPDEAAVEGGGATADGKTVRWTVNLSEANDNAAAVENADAIVTVRCPAKGLTFEPEHVMRPELMRFDDVEEAMLDAGPGEKLDALETQNAFVPVLLKVERESTPAGAELIDKHGWMHDGAVLAGAFVVPRELEPLEWGKPTVTQAVDNLGYDLLDESRMPDERLTSDSWVEMFQGRIDEKTDTSTIYCVILPFGMPVPGAKSIALLKGSIDVRFGGGRYRVCIPNAIVADDLQDSGGGVQAMLGNPDTTGGRTMTSPLLEKAGAGLRVTEVLRMPGCLRFHVITDNAAAPVLAAQAYDAAGRPWPTIPLQDILAAAGYSGRAGTFLVAGEPELPLSLVCEVNAGGRTVTLPIDLKDIPIEARAYREGAEDSEGADDSEGAEDSEGADDADSEEGAAQ